MIKRVIMRGARIKFGCMNVHSIQIRKFKRLERKLNRSKNPAAVLSLQETWTNAKSRVIQDIKQIFYAEQRVLFLSVTNCFL